MDDFMEPDITLHEVIREGRFVRKRSKISFLLVGESTVCVNPKIFAKSRSNSAKI